MTVIYIFTIVFFVVSAAVHILLSEDPKVTLYSDIIAVVAGALPIIAFLYAFLYFEKGVPEKRVLLIFFTGMILWLLGEIMWLYYEGLMDIDPFPSVADLFWIHGYIAIFIALILQYKSLKVRLEKRYEVGIAIGVAIVGMIMLSILFFLIIGEEDFTLLEQIISLYYPVADFCLLYMALLITGLYWKGKLSYARLLIALGIMAYCVGDVWFAYLEWEGIYREVLWHPVNFTWIIGDLLFFLGAFKYRLTFEELV